MIIVDSLHAPEQEVEPTFRVEVVDDPSTMLDLEVERVRWCLSHYADYRAKGYSSILRFPETISPELEYGDEQVQAAVQSEMDSNMELYLGFATQFGESLGRLQSEALPIVSQLYGFSAEGTYIIAPTAYGVIGGQLVSGGPIFFRLPQYYPPDLGTRFTTGTYRTEVELLTHEILAHGMTSRLRDGTTIDESNPKCSHQWHKERLMDLLGKTILSRSNIMHADNVTMGTKAIEEASGDIDPLFYQNDGLSWEGDLAGLITRVDSYLRST